MDLKLNNNYQENNYKKEIESDQQMIGVVNKTDSGNSIISKESNDILEPGVGDKPLGLGNIIDPTGLKHSVPIEDYKHPNNSNRLNQQNNYIPKFINGLGNIQYNPSGSGSYKILGGVDLV